MVSEGETGEDEEVDEEGSPPEEGLEEAEADSRGEAVEVDMVVEDTMLDPQQRSLVGYLGKRKERSHSVEHSIGADCRTCIHSSRCDLHPPTPSRRTCLDFPSENGRLPLPVKRPTPPLSTTRDGHFHARDRGRDGLLLDQPNQSQFVPELRSCHDAITATTLPRPGALSSSQDHAAQVLRRLTLSFPPTLPLCCL